MNKTYKQTNTNWFRLDNSAAIYPMIRTLSAQSLFRLGAELYDDIDKDALSSAVEKAYKRFPYFKVELQMGFFRPYFITNHRKHIIEEDEGYLLRRIDFYRNAGYLIRIAYYGKKVFADFFHGLSDGVGALEFFKSVIYYYLLQIGKDVHHEDKISIIEQPYSKDEVEDSFRKHHSSVDFKKGFEIMASGLALPIKGKKFKREGLGLIQGSVKTQELLTLSRRYDCSITVFLSALSIYSIANTQDIPKKNKKDYVIFIPVNLRNYFSSCTNFNFTTLVKCSINPNEVPLTLESYIKSIKEQLVDRLDKGELALRVGFTSLMDKNKVLRYTPLFIKSFMAKIGRSFTGGSKQTLIFSNLGRATMPESFEKHIKELFFNQNCNNKTPNNIGVISFFDRTVISFSRAVREREIERFFFSYLARLGLNVEVKSNFREM